MMPIQLELTRSGRVLLATYSNPINTGDLESAFQKYEEICDSATATVHNITDVLAVSELPSNVLTLARKYYNSSLHHERAGTFIVVTNNAFFVSLSRLATQLMPGMRVLFVSTLEQAWRQVDRLTQEAPDSHER